MDERLPVNIERVILIGLSGTGKTTVARVLAARLGWAAADSDEWIVARAGRPIADIFATEGEPRFRQMEHEALHALVERDHLVLATGAGIVTVERNWPLLRQASRVVWLQAPADQIIARLQSETTETRPLLAGDDPLGTLHAMTTARAPLYARADIAIDTADRQPEEVAARVLAALSAGERVAAMERPTKRDDV